MKMVKLPAQEMTVEALEALIAEARKPEKIEVEEGLWSVREGSFRRSHMFFDGLRVDAGAHTDGFSDDLVAILRTALSRHIARVKLRDGETAEARDAWGSPLTIRYDGDNDIRISGGGVSGTIYLPNTPEAIEALTDALWMAHEGSK